MNKLDELIQQLCPNGVPYKRLGDVATISRGGNFQKKDFTESGVPCIHYGQIYTRYGLFVNETITYIGEETAQKQKFAEPNDVVMAVTSENIEDVCKCVAWLGDGKVAVSGHAAIIHHSMNPKYLVYWLHSSSFYQQKAKSGIIVKGLYDVAVHFSKCCSPVPGDEIVGFVTRGRGVSIHRTDCINIMNLSELEKVRLIDAEWQQGAEQGDNGLYLAEIKIFGNNRTGRLVDITRIFTEREIDISSINSKTSKQGVATISISFNTKGKEELSSLIEKIRQVESVIDIERTTG